MRGLLTGCAVCALIAVGTVAQAARIEGVVNDASTAAPVAGARVILLFDEQDVLAPGDQIEVAQTGDDGGYAFDVAEGRRYRIEVDVAAIAHGFPSSQVPPQPGFAPIGPVVTAARPSARRGADRRYFLRFDILEADDAITNNHIALDALPDVVQLAKRADQPTASTGDIVGYTLVLTNRSGRDLVAADGRAVSILDAPPRGLSYVNGSAAATVRRGASVGEAVRGVDRIENRGSKRLVRFGPFDLPAGAELTIQYQATVGVDTRPGHYVNTAVALDPGGVELSARATARVEIVPDRDFETSVVLGRVFCDQDGDGRVDDGEGGVLGARVYVDTGSYAVSDSAGLFHLSRVPAGSHLVKLDAGTLAGSKLRGEPTRLLRLTEGLADTVSFPVDCVTERVTIDHPRASLSRGGKRVPPPRGGGDPSQVEIEGELTLLHVSVDGTALDLPAAVVAFDVPAAIRVGGASAASDEGINLIDVPAAGYAADKPTWRLSWTSPGGITARRWTFAIRRVDASARLGAAVFTLSGRGEPPASVAWDGRTDAGAPASSGIYAAQLTVIGSDRNVEAASAHSVFGVAHGLATGSAQAQVWTGALFTGSARSPAPTAELRKRINELKASLGPDDRLDIQVHWDGTGERLSTIARTQREARKLVELLAAVGIPTDRVSARGRGSLEPAEPPRTPAARKNNRRITIAVIAPPSAGTVSVPMSIAVDADALIEGKVAKVDDRGRFRATVTVPTRRALLIDVRALDGRRAAIDVSLGARSSRDRGGDSLAPRKVQVDGDLAGRTLRVDFEPVAARLLELDVVLAGAGGAVPDVAIRRRLPAARLEFQLTVPDSLAARSWRLSITDDEGRAVGGSAGTGPVPHTWSWDGKDAESAPALTAGRRYLYQLAVELEDGSAGWSPTRAFTVDRKRAGNAAKLATEPPLPAPAVSINGIARELAGDAFSTSIEIPVGGAVIVDLTDRAGHRARVHAVAGGDSQRARAELLDPDQPDVPVVDDPPPLDPDRELRTARAARLEAVLPPEGTVLGSDELPVRGIADSQGTLSINGTAVHVAADGRYATVVRVPSGQSVLTIVARDRAGVVATIAWPLSVRARQTFAMAFGEGIAATSYTSRGWFGDTAYLSGMNEDTTLPVGQVLLSARLAFYLKARLSETGPFDRIDITTHVDTGRRDGASALFENLVDPNQDLAVYGDSSTEVRDVNTRGKVYVRVEADGSRAVVGAVKTDFHGGSLLGYDRTFDGAAIEVDHEIGVHRPGLQAFGTPSRTDHSRDINLYRATGGSLYYLRHGSVLEGSEQVRVMLRDRQTGLVLSERELLRNRDYTIDYDGGRVLLIEPLASAAPADSLIHDFDSASLPLDGNPVYLQIGYEHADPTAPGQRAGGVYARDVIADRVSLGGGALIEERGADTDYSVWGADAIVRAGAQSTVRAEIAGSRERDGANVLSQDGGLSFGDLDQVSRTTGDSGRGLNLGWKVAVDLAGADAVESGVLAGTRLSLYAQDLDRGFSSSNTILEQGRLKYGGAIDMKLGARDRLTLRHDGEQADLPRLGPTADDVAAADPLALDERRSDLTALSWAGDRGRWHHRLEAAHQRLTSTSTRAPDPVTGDIVDALDARRIGFGVGTRLDVTDRLAVRAGQQLIVDAGDADPVLSPIDPMSTANRDDNAFAGVISNVGSDVLLAEGLRVSADYFQRWNGDSAAQLGLRSTLSETGSMYVAERFGARGGQLVSTTVIGADDRFGEARGGKTYGEYQIDHGVLGQRNRALLGLGHRWQIMSGISLGGGFEHQQASGGFLPDGTPIGDSRRDVIAAGVDYTGHDRVKAAAQVELRFEQGLAGAGAADDLVRDDPRSVTDPGGFADHGGVAPGAPLVIPPGERIQLVTGGGLDWQVARDITLFGRVRWSHTVATDEVATGSDEDVIAARYAEGSAGWAYRPLTHDWFNLLARYSFVLDRRPLIALATGSETRTHAVAVIPVADLPYSLRLSGKLAIKTSDVARLGLAPADPGESAPELETGAEALLALIRLGYRVFGNWDITGEYRTLIVFKPVDDERRHGTLWEVGYSVGRYVRIGAGYNLSRFSDNELSLERDSHGVFIRVTGQY